MAPQLDPPYNVDLDAPGWGGAFSRYLLLRYWPDLLVSEGVTKGQVYYSMCYWFQRYVTSYTAENGPDVGLEQQVNNLLAYPTIEDVDWYLLEAVYHRAIADAALPL